jgi:hypothetical protein
MSPYGPLYYWVVGLGLQGFGYQFWFARAVALICLMLSAACIARVTARFTGDRHLAALSVLLFLAQFPVQAWAAVQRPDFLALALSLLGIMAAVDVPRPSRYSQYLSPLLSGCVLCLAILTRQTSVLPVGIVTGWYLFTGQHRLFAVFVGSVAGLLGIVTICLQLTSDGGYVWQQFLLPTGVAKSPQHSVSVLLALLAAPATLVTALLWLVGYFRLDATLLPAGGQSPAAFSRYRVLMHIYLGLAVAVAAITSGRSGANVNYWLEASAAMAMATPTLFIGVLPRSGHSGRYLMAVVALSLASLVTEVRVIRGEWYRWSARSYMDEVVLAIARMTTEGRPVFSVYPELPTAARRPHYFNDFVQYDGRSPRHGELLRNVLESGALAVIVTHTRESPKGYRVVPMSRAVPEKFYPVFVHARTGEGGSL